MYLDQNNIPFYIGKGFGGRFRPRLHLHSTNKFLKNKICKVGVKNVKIYFLHENIIEEESFRWENYWIKYIGRRDLKEGTLCNLTDGGEGDSGRKHSEETKRKIGCGNKGKVRTELMKQHQREIHEGKPIPATTGKNHHMYGKHHSEKTKRKMSKVHKGRVPWNKGKRMPEGFGEKISQIVKNRYCKKENN